ncbi:SDR family NAD(P)-dependent oxidoreductase [Pelagerythrobacter marensis]|uniref:Putative 3-KETOACYL-COA THIOLASE n=1 Tax=Pelagerythrobacter marensis TaxID=543877 RepID=A0A0G3X7A4_9SPHN|nr:SDR family NAD(P)-dependent oxidoreductase [Pelagerythrobacter marensis]AKM06504.1 Putative 3-KETOACYL-COA THIOLASE [Pelagerythrobacter marensis]
MKLENKTIVMTGGSSGVGLEILRRLAPGNRIVNLSRSAPPRDAGHGDAFDHVETDLADPVALERAIERIGTLCPEGIDSLICCAAVQFTPRLADPTFDRATIAREIAVNLTAPIVLVAGLLRGLMRRPGAFVLNVNSGLALVPKAESAVYCATKAGLDNFSRGLRAQLADCPVRVVQAFLPLVDTPMTAGRGTGKLSADEAARQILEGVERGVADNDIGKVGLLRLVQRISPSLARRIIQGGGR